MNKININSILSRILEAILFSVAATFQGLIWLSIIGGIGWAILSLLLKLYGVGFVDTDDYASLCFLVWTWAARIFCVVIPVNTCWVIFTGRDNWFNAFCCTQDKK